MVDSNFKLKEGERLVDSCQGAWGTTIRKDDYIVYAGAEGSSSAFLNKGRVIAIVELLNRNNEPSHYLRVFRSARNQWEKDGRIVTITNTHATVPLNQGNNE